MPGFSFPQQTLGGKGQGPYRPTYWRRGGEGMAVRVREGWEESNECHRERNG